MKIIVLIGLMISFLLSAGCASVTGTSTKYTSWQGDKIYVGEGGAVTMLEGLELWEHGSPSKPYKIVGVIEQTSSADSTDQFIFGAYTNKELVRYINEASGDGVITIRSDKKLSGYTVPMRINEYDNRGVTADYSNIKTMAVFKYVAD